MYTSQATKPQVHVRECFEGRIANTPTDTADDLFAIFPIFEDEGAHPHRHGPLYGWDAHSGGALPTEGDLVLATVSDQGNYWCLGWNADV